MDTALHGAHRALAKQIGQVTGAIDAQDGEYLSPPIDPHVLSRPDGLAVLLLQTIEMRTVSVIGKNEYIDMILHLSTSSNSCPRPRANISPS